MPKIGQPLVTYGLPTDVSTDVDAYVNGSLALYIGDCLEVLPRLSSRLGTYNLIVADPPFNINYNYDNYSDNKPPTDYLTWTSAWLTLCKAHLHSYGSIYVCMGDNYVAQTKLMMDQLFYYRNWIIWYYTFGTACQRKFSRSHTHILYYTAHPKQYVFNADAIRIPSDRQLRYNDIRANPLGKLPDDVWQYSRVCGTFKERSIHPCQMPVDLLERIILASSNVGDGILDPFVGSGTTGEAALKHGRSFTGIDTSRSYITDICIPRLQPHVH